MGRLRCPAIARPNTWTSGCRKCRDRDYNNYSSVSCLDWHDNYLLFCQYVMGLARYLLLGLSFFTNLLRMHSKLAKCIHAHEIHYYNYWLKGGGGELSDAADGGWSK